MSEESNKGKSFWKWVIFTSILFLIAIFFILTDNFPHWIKACATLKKQNRQIEYYQEQIRQMDAQIDALSTDRDSLETYAREKFHFAEPGDDIYLTED